MTHPSLADALQRADLVHNSKILNEAISRIGDELTQMIAGERAVMLSLMHGGMIFAGQLALSIRTDLEFDYIHATRYRGATQGTELHWMHQPAATLAGRTVILADDILDEGKTLKAVRDFCLDRGARRVLIAVLCEKRHGRCVDGVFADVCGVEVPDRYVFGFGMDYYEQGRNLPAIYAI